ncbi:guanine nucleotide-binding protein g(o) subunit alpha [Anaeramoeba flamelloides]|uniref:Guanine nucleotide-binding protein g(O) subunit alpha n=1 Tax=Anaeramoeba flamelloides TaxID=1746091 RepID=A0ABQ8YJT7_9EUKA|nr:guanine nucleotide-binding protein g(o) subunit alpha [Anaeramoeba flamelloides]
MGNTTKQTSPKEELIDQKLIQKKEKENEKEKQRILMLGAGDGGKSTIFKQLKILYQEGYSREEKEKFRKEVRSNIYYTLTEIYYFMKTNNIPYYEPSHKDLLKEIKNGGEKEIVNHYEKIKKIMTDKAVQKVINEIHKTQIHESALDFIEDASRIFQKDYIPTLDDILKIHRRTTGIMSDYFSFDNLDLEIFDVGGQRNERKKWIHAYAETKAIIFVVNLNEYDKVLFECSTHSRMGESLLIFDDICNSRWFNNIPVIIFFNQIDRFEKKVQKKNLNCHFQDYVGGLNFQNALEFIKNKFSSLNKTNREIHIFETCALDTGKMKQIFMEVTKILKDFYSLDKELKGQREETEKEKEKEDEKEDEKENGKENEKENGKEKEKEK